MRYARRVIVLFHFAASDLIAHLHRSSRSWRRVESVNLGVPDKMLRQAVRDAELAGLINCRAGDIKLTRAGRAAAAAQ